MASYARIFEGDKNKESAENAKAIIHAAVKLLMSEATITDEPSGTMVKVQFNNRDENLMKILEGLGFQDFWSGAFSPKPERKKYTKKPKPPKVELTADEAKFVERKDFPSDQVGQDFNQQSSEEKTGEYHVEPGRYKKDGTDVVYNAAGLTIRLQRQEFGPGIRFFREGDGTKWVVVLLETGYQLKPVED